VSAGQPKSWAIENCNAPTRKPTTRPSAFQADAAGVLVAVYPYLKRITLVHRSRYAGLPRSLDPLLALSNLFTVVRHGQADAAQATVGLL
jgi:hypothetical protein